MKASMYWMTVALVGAVIGGGLYQLLVSLYAAPPWVGFLVGVGCAAVFGYIAGAVRAVRRPW